MSKHILKRILVIAAAVACTGFAGTTNIRIENTPKVTGVKRFGMNMGKDSFYASPLMKKRVTLNWEGTLYAAAHFGPAHTKDGVSSWFGAPGQSWDQFLKAGKDEYVILSGPEIWKTGTIREIGSMPFTHKGQSTPKRLFVLDTPLATPLTSTGGFMIRANRPREGYIGNLYGAGNYWSSKGNHLVYDDVRPGGFGVAAMNVVGSQGRGFIRLIPHGSDIAPIKGSWKLRCWAKASKGSPALQVKTEPASVSSQSISLTSNWQEIKISLDTTTARAPSKGFFSFVMNVSGGDALLDDIELWMEGDRNPTAFRDDIVDTLKSYRPGSLRYLQMGGNTLDNMLAPALRRRAFTSNYRAKSDPRSPKTIMTYGIHEFYELCAYLKADPWFCLPGTLEPKDMKAFMEYVAAPPTEGYGKKRAKLGQKTPWTEVFDTIHVEFGNEAWNGALAYRNGGFNGPGYWKSLIETGKQSPFYRKNVIFHVGGQAVHSSRNSRIIANAPNADSLTVAPYLMFTLSKEQAAPMEGNDAKLFSWAFGYPVLWCTDPKGAMFKNAESAAKANMQLSSYEVNHHLTAGNAGLGIRNRLVSSQGGAVNLASAMWIMLAENRMRVQNLFAFMGADARMPGQKERVKLWGTVIDPRKETRRFRPTFLACQLSNRALEGDLMTTTHSGAKPTFTLEGPLPYRGSQTRVDGISTIWSFATRSKKRNHLVLFNLDVAQSHEVRVEFEGPTPSSATLRTFWHSDIAADNESSNTVKISEKRLTEWKSGSKLTLPPHSMQVISWPAGK